MTCVTGIKEDKYTVNYRRYWFSYHKVKNQGSKIAQLTNRCMVTILKPLESFYIALMKLKSLVPTYNRSALVLLK